MTNDTWKKCRKSNDMNIVTSKWIFIVKYTLNESVNRYKTRLVARDFTQVYKVNFTEIFASTMKINSLRTLLTIMTLENMKVEQVNVNNVFIESFLKEKIYMQASFELRLKTERVLLLRRSLYDLKQFAREWNRKCNKTLTKLEF